MLKTRTLAAIALLCAFAVRSADAQTFNGQGSTTHSAVTTAYTTGQLFALNTSGSAVASPLVITNSQPGEQLINKAMIQSSGTNQPPTITLFLFTAPPVTTSLVDRSAYLGPYAADLSGAIYLGSLTCSSWNKTNDGTAQYYSECSTSSLMLSVQPVPSGGAGTTIYVLESIGGAYAPLTSEKHSYFVSTLRNN